MLLCGVESSEVQEKTMYQLQSQDLVNRRGVVPIPLEMATHDGFETLPFQVRTRQGPRVQQHLPHILGERIPIPKPEVIELVAAEEEPFGVERREQMIDSRHPLGHTMVVRILRLEGELQQAAGYFCRQASVVSCETAIGPNLQ